MTMSLPDNQYVYHGSHEVFDVVVPKQNRRIRKGEVIFNQLSFHATPYRWIALAYTCMQKPIQREGKMTYYMMGVDLYTHDLSIYVYGVDSLEHSLTEMYGEGGYLYTYDAQEFYHTKGLGNLEVITERAITPVRVERIEDPVAELISAGVQFVFKDLSDPMHAEYWS
jgi:hypothetical protein